MQRPLNFSVINHDKANFDDIYISKDPRRYFRVLGQLDYIIPHLAQPIIEQLILARAKRQRDPVTVLDLGCSYGVNGALMKYRLNYDTLRERYTSPALQGLTSDEILSLDRAFYRAWPKSLNVQVIGLDVSEPAVRYAEASGAIDCGIALNLETTEPTREQAGLLADVDLIVSTGCVGYVTSRTFQRLARLARKGRPAWVASFVLRMFTYDDIARTLMSQNLETERFDGATFIQRRFASVPEMEAAVRAVEMRGLDTRGYESDGLLHADLYVSRPEEEIERMPLHRMVHVVSGVNKPWRIGTNALRGARAADGRRKNAHTAAAELGIR
jgi:SAM-dependent methyltransferase